MTLIAGLFMAATAQPVPAPSTSIQSPIAAAIDCVRLKARPLAVTARTETGIAYEAVRACEARLDALPSPREGASERERNTSASLRIALLDRMFEEAQAAVRQQRGR
ncbi:MAG TPA: hypothetical protein VFP12_09885 [Allosphingosinicella sp.]|nr:hypothetical protein [Allosphingosinicella sp.]